MRIYHKEHPVVLSLTPNNRKMSDTTRTDSHKAVQLRLVSHINETLPPHPAPLNSTGVNRVTLFNAVPDDVNDCSLVSEYAARVPCDSSATLGSTIVQLASGFDIEYHGDSIAPFGLLAVHKNRPTSPEDLTAEDAEGVVDLKPFQPEPQGGSAAIVPSSATSTRGITPGNVSTADAQHSSVQEYSGTAMPVNLSHSPPVTNSCSQFVFQPRSDGLYAATGPEHTVPEQEPLQQVSYQPQTITQSVILPLHPTVCHARDKDIERLVSLVTISCIMAPIGIVGPGGIGKTTLALKVLHEPRVQAHFATERFFLDCEAANGIDEVLTMLMLELGVRQSQNTSLWSTVFDNIRSRQQSILVLDNFETMWSALDDELRESSEALLTQLAALDQLTLVVTTRRNYITESFNWKNCDTAELESLSSASARTLFTEWSALEPYILASEPEAEALTQLLCSANFMLLAVDLLTRLNELPSRLLHEWLEHSSEVLDAERHDGAFLDLSIEVAIRIALAHLPAETADFQPRQLLSALDRRPTGLSPGTLDQLRTSVTNINSTAQALWIHLLAYYNELGELKMLSVVRDYALACLPMSSDMRSAMGKIYEDTTSCSKTGRHGFVALD